MSVFFFGPRNHRLLGYYHAPAGEGRGNILLCQPWGIEYQYAHRTLRFLGRRLAEDGWHVLRFDYSGTGDSWGETWDADLTGWVEDIQLASNELETISGVRETGLVGLRLGATLSLRAAGHMGEVRRLVLWDPVVDGPAWIEELKSKAKRTPARLSGDGRVELGRHTISETLLRQIADLQLDGFDPSAADRALVLGTQEDDPACAWRPPPKEGLDVEELIQPAPWIEDIALGSGQIPVKAVAKVVEWLGTT